MSSFLDRVRILAAKRMAKEKQEKQAEERMRRIKDEKDLMEKATKSGRQYAMNKTVANRDEFAKCLNKCAE